MPDNEMQATLFLNRQVTGLQPNRAERFWWMARVIDDNGRIEVEMCQLSRSASREDCEMRGRAFLSRNGFGLRVVMEGIWTSAECDYAEEVEADSARYFKSRRPVAPGEDCPIPAGLS